MKIFISWSGERSRIIAEGLNHWLPKVIQAVKPFYSPEIEKGTKGIEQINKTLEGTSFGIICLTPDNLQSTWIHYEAGALSKIEDARIWTLLFNLKHSNVVQPLAQFQHTLANKQDIYKLLDSINAKLVEPLEKSVLNESLERWWSDFEETLQKANEFLDENQESNQDSKNIRSERDILEEILELLRNQQRQNNTRIFDSQSGKNRQESIYTEMKFLLTTKIEKFTEEQISEYVELFFPTSRFKVLRQDNGLKVEMQFRALVDLESVRYFIKRLEQKTEYKVSDCTLTDANGFWHTIMDL